MWFKLNSNSPKILTDEEIKKYVIRQLLDLFESPEIDLIREMSIKELKVKSRYPPFNIDPYTSIDESILCVATSSYVEKFKKGEGYIETVGEYSDYMVFCNLVNPKQVRLILEEYSDLNLNKQKFYWRGHSYILDFLIYFCIFFAIVFPMVFEKDTLFIVVILMLCLTVPYYFYYITPFVYQDYLKRFSKLKNSNKIKMTKVRYHFFYIAFDFFSLLLVFLLFLGVRHLLN